MRIVRQISKEVADIPGEVIAFPLRATVGLMDALDDALSEDDRKKK